MPMAAGATESAGTVFMVVDLDTNHRAVSVRPLYFLYPKSSKMMCIFNQRFETKAKTSHLRLFEEVFED